MTRTAVITGLGAPTPIGGDVPTFWSHALQGVSGARTMEHDWVEKYELPRHAGRRAASLPAQHPWCTMAPGSTGAATWS